MQIDWRALGVGYKETTTTIKGTQASARACMHMDHPGGARAGGLCIELVSDNALLFWATLLDGAPSDCVPFSLGPATPLEVKALTVTG